MTGIGLLLGDMNDSGRHLSAALGPDVHVFDISIGKDISGKFTHRELQ